jgi:hypothetical protein
VAVLSALAALALGCLLAAALTTVITATRRPSSPS